jgi:hypothetical protein
MSRRRKALFALSVVVSALTIAPSAMARTYSGEGIWGPTNDLTITIAMFILIAFFPGIIILFSLIQAFLDHRKHARYDAAKARASSEEWKGGW